MAVPGKSDLTAVWCVDATLDAERAVRRLMQPFWGVMLVVWATEQQQRGRGTDPQEDQAGRGSHPSLPLFSPVLPSSNKTQLALPYGPLFLSLSNSRVVFIDFRRIYIPHLLSSAMYQTFRLYPRGIMGCMPLLPSENLLILGLGTRGQESGQKLEASFILLKSNSGFPPWP